VNAWYARYPGDYLRDTAHLSLTEHGAYGLLLDHYYSTEKPLPNNKDALYRICRALNDGERLAVDSVLAQFFRLSEDGYHNARADRELEKRSDRNQKLSDSGRRGARERWKGSGNNSERDSQAYGDANGEANGPASGPSIASPQPQPQPQPHPPAKAQPQPEKVSSSESKTDSDTVTNVSGSNSSRKPKTPPSETGLLLADRLRSRILQNNINAKITAAAVLSWAHEADLMMRCDQRTEQQIADLIDWSQQDAFWRQNVLSMGKLREKFDQLTLKKQPIRKVHEHGHDHHDTDRAAEEFRRHFDGVAP
jgi:uncharacterized protein YdaU (DUF1376 family)